VWDTGGVDVESHLDLRANRAAPEGSFPSELPQRHLVHRHRALALQHVDVDRRLAILRGGEHSDILKGIVALRGISVVMTPPMVSTSSEIGVTSRRRTSFTSAANTPAWMAAPFATASSGLTPL
jgi:hypothetical protein